MKILQIALMKRLKDRTIKKQRSRRWRL